MARAGARVVIVSSSASGVVARDEVVKRSGSTDVHLLLADMSLQSSVRELARQINDNWNSISAIIHHGTYHDLKSTKREVTSEGFERFWAQNHLGPFLLTHLLKDGLARAHGRVVTLGSTRLKVYPRLAVDADDPSFERRSFSANRAFFQSKIAQIQFAAALPRHWTGTGVTAKSLSVPAVGADTVRRGKLPWYHRISVRGADAATPRKIGDLYAVVALSPKVAKIPAGYLDKNLDSAWAPSAAFDEEAQEATWAVSVKETGV